MRVGTSASSWSIRVCCICVAGHLWTEELRHIGRGRRWDDVWSQEELLSHRGQRPAGSLHGCTRARLGYMACRTGWNVVLQATSIMCGFEDIWVILNHTFEHLETYKCHVLIVLLQVTCWACLTTTPRPVRGCLEIWEDTTWWLLCSSASTRQRLGLPAALSTLLSSLTMDTVGNISGWHADFWDNTVALLRQIQRGIKYTVIPLTL